MNKNANYGSSDEGPVYIYYDRINFESEKAAPLCSLHVKDKGNIGNKRWVMKNKKTISGVRAEEQDENYGEKDADGTSAKKKEREEIMSENDCSSVMVLKVYCSGS